MDAAQSNNYEPENCEPCEMLGLTNLSVGRTGMDFTPVCGWHFRHSWSSPPPSEPQVEKVTFAKQDGSMAHTMWGIEFPDGTSLGPFDSETEARAHIAEDRR